MAVETSTAEQLIRRIYSFQRAMRCAHHFAVDPGGPGLALQGVMRLIGDAEEVRATDLADRLGIGAAALSRHIADLEASGHLSRRQDPADGRAFLLSLTDQGRTSLRAAAVRRANLLQEMLTDWSDDDAALAAAMMERLATTLENSLRAKKPGQHSQQSMAGAAR
jgi:DNA-binding MarR family transcriptional regulator